MKACNVSKALMIGAAVILPGASMAQTNCAPRATIVERLASKYQETMIGGGLQNATTLLEIWTSETTGSFTVLMTRPDGTSCVVSSGQNWNSIIEAKADLGQTS